MLRSLVLQLDAKNDRRNREVSLTAIRSGTKKQLLGGLWLEFHGLIPCHGYYAVRADGDFDMVAFLSPIGIGFVMLIALVGGKYLQHPDLQGFFGGLSTIVTIAVAFSVAYLCNISFSQSSIGLLMGSLAIGFGVYRSIGPTKVSDGEILTAGVAVGLMGLKASSSDPLTGRIVGYMVDILLLTAACVVLPSGRRMGTSGILVRSTVLLFTEPFEHLTDETRAVPMTFLASLSSAMDVEVLAQDSPMSYLTFLGRVKVCHGCSVSFGVRERGPSPPVKRWDSCHECISFQELVVNLVLTTQLGLPRVKMRPNWSLLLW